MSYIESMDYEACIKERKPRRKSTKKLLEMGLINRNVAQNVCAILLFREEEKVLRRRIKLLRGQLNTVRYEIGLEEISMENILLGRKG